MLKIYVGNLNPRTTAESVQKLFALHGEVADVAMATDKETGELRGFCFVFMPDDEEGRTAIRLINGKTLDNRTLSVVEANKGKKKKKRAPGTGPGPGPGARRAGARPSHRPRRGFRRRP